MKNSVEVIVGVDGNHKKYTVSKEEIEQIACNKAREDNPKAQGIYATSVIIKWGNK